MSDAALPLELAVEPSADARLRGRLLGTKSLVVGTAILAVAILVAVFAPLIATHDPYAQDLTRRLIPPIWYRRAAGTMSSARTISAAITCPAPSTARASP